MIAGSAYNSALLLDLELAEATKGQPKATHPQLWRFDAHMQRLTDLGDILLKTAVAKGGGDVDAAHLRRPLTAADHLDLDRRQRNMNKLFQVWFPDHMDKIPTISPR